jgi:gas vesicle protein
MSENNRTGDVVLGFVFGAVVGAGVALLLAPALGQDTRRKIGDTARRLGDGMSGRLGEMKDNAIKRASEINGDVKDAIDAGLAAASGR